MLYYTFLSPKSSPTMVNLLKEIKREGGAPKGSITFTGPKRLTILVNCDSIGIPFGIKFGYNK